MAASIDSRLDDTSSSRQMFYPDGRQTRIDFFSYSNSGKDSQALDVQKGSFDWWHQLTAWLKSGKSVEARDSSAFFLFLEKRGYSAKTCKSYHYMLNKFFIYLDEKKATVISPAMIEDYNYDFFVKGRYSRSYQLQFINSLTLYLEFTEGRKVNLKGLRKSRRKSTK